MLALLYRRQNENEARNLREARLQRPVFGQQARVDQQRRASLPSEAASSNRRERNASSFSARV